LGVAFIVRLFGLLSRPIWYDEGIAMLVAEKGPQQILQSIIGSSAQMAANVHPPTYFLFLWGWMKMFGGSVVAARLASILFGCGTVALTYKFVKSLFTVNTALWAAFLVAISPFQVHYSQEIRMYIMMTFFLLGATYFLWKGLNDRGIRYWILFALFSAAAQYFQSLSAFYLLPLALTSLFTKDIKKIIATFVSGLGAMVIYIPWLLMLPSQLSKIQNSYWVQKPGMEKSITLLLIYVTNLPLPNNLLPIGVILTITVTILIFWLVLKMAITRRPQWKRMVWMGYLAFTPPLLLFVVSQWTPIYVERALLICSVPFYILAAWILTQVSIPKLIRSLITIALVAGMVLGIWQHVYYAGFPYGPYQQISSYLKEHAAPNDAIIHSNKLTFIPTLYFDRLLPQEFIADAPGSGSDTLSSVTQAVLKINAIPDIETAANANNHLFYIIFNKAIEEYQSGGFTTHPDLEWLSSHYELVNTTNWGEIQLFEYKK
jgi:mannosyltransferase